MANDNKTMRLSDKTNNLNIYSDPKHNLGIMYSQNESTVKPG